MGYSGQHVYDDGTNVIELSSDEVLLFGVGEAAPGIGGPNQVTSTCYFDGRRLADGDAVFSHARLPPEGVPDESYTEWALSWSKDYCLEHFQVELLEYPK